MRWSTVAFLLVLALATTGLGGAGSTPTAGLIVYSGGKGRHADVYVINANGRGRRQLTKTATDEYCPTWSPDGKTIALTAVKGTQSSVELISANGHTIWRLPGVTCGGWSPDGSHLLFARDDGLYLVGPDGQNPTKLVTPIDEVGSWPAWSPDGTQLAFASASSDDESDATKTRTIEITSTNGTLLGEIAVTPPSSWCPPTDCRLYRDFFTWAPGMDIAFVLVTGDLYPERLYAIGADGTNQRLLSGKLLDVYWPAWSPDGKQIAFVYRAGGRNDQVWLADSRGQHIRKTTRVRSSTSNLSGCYYPAWAADGMRIACWGHAGGMYVASTSSGRSHLAARDVLTSDEFPASWQPMPNH